MSAYIELAGIKTCHSPTTFEGYATTFIFCILLQIHDFNCDTSTLILIYITFTFTSTLLVYEFKN